MWRWLFFVAVSAILVAASPAETSGLAELLGESAFKLQQCGQQWKSGENDFRVCIDFTNGEYAKVEVAIGEGDTVQYVRATLEAKSSTDKFERLVDRFQERCSILGQVLTEEFQRQVGFRCSAGAEDYFAVIDKPANDAAGDSRLKLHVSSSRKALAQQGLKTEVTQEVAVTGEADDGTGKADRGASSDDPTQGKDDNSDSSSGEERGAGGNARAKLGFPASRALNLLYRDLAKILDDETVACTGDWWSSSFGEYTCSGFRTRRGIRRVTAIQRTNDVMQRIRIRVPSDRRGVAFDELSKRLSSACTVGRRGTVQRTTFAGFKCKGEKGEFFAALKHDSSGDASFTELTYARSPKKLEIRHVNEVQLVAKSESGENPSEDGEVDQRKNQLADEGERDTIPTEVAKYVGKNIPSVSCSAGWGGSVKFDRTCSSAKLSTSDRLDMSSVELELDDENGREIEYVKSDAENGFGIAHSQLSRACNAVRASTSDRGDEEAPYYRVVFICDDDSEEFVILLEQFTEHYTSHWSIHAATNRTVLQHRSGIEPAEFRIEEMPKLNKIGDTPVEGMGSLLGKELDDVRCPEGWKSGKYEEYRCEWMAVGLPDQQELEYIEVEVDASDRIVYARARSDAFFDVPDDQCNGLKSHTNVKPRTLSECTVNGTSFFVVNVKSLGSATHIPGLLHAGTTREVLQKESGISEKQLDMSVE